MWIVKIALQRPYPLLVMAFLRLLLGPLAILKTATDIFPSINIPVVSVIWGSAGLPPQEMSDRITNYFDRIATTAVNNIEHIESNAYNGVSVSKYFFHPGTNVDLSMSQTTAAAQYLTRNFPPGTPPPLVLSYNASTVPVLQLALSSKTISEQGLY